MKYSAVLLPSGAVGMIFYFVMRAIFQADRPERKAEHDAEAAYENAVAQDR